MAQQHSSAGVYVNEIDLSQRVQAVSSSIAAIVGESVRGPVGQRTMVTDTKQFLALFGKPNAKTSFMHYCALAYLEFGNRLYVTRIAPQALHGGVVFGTLNGLSTVAPFVAGISDPTLQNFVGTDLFTIVGANPGAWNSELSVSVYPNTKANDGTFFIDVMSLGSARPVEKYLVHLNYVIDGYGVQINVEEHINKRSSLIRIVQNRVQPEFVTNPNRIFINTLLHSQLAGGVDAIKATTSDIITGWELYRDVEQVDVNLLINGGYSIPAIQKNMDDICTQRMDCMAILDVPSTEQAVSNAINFRRNTLMLDSSYSALYCPDYMILDEYNDINIYVPPSGHIAGVYARTDSEAELWFAPAGMNRGRLNIRGVLQNYNQGDRDALYDSQINATRVIPGAGIKVWGADTLQTMASALSNVNVRRLMMFLEKSLGIAALYSVFDPHDVVLRAALKDICERFLKPIKDARGVYAFGVQCDEFNNPPEIVAAGDLNLDIYIDPALPVKRIHLTAIVSKTGAKLVQG
jgi:phage tail sheath protein FI